MFSPENWWIGSSLNRPGSIVHLADELVGCEAFEDLQSPSEIVGADEVGEMPAELIMAVVVVASGRRLRWGPVDSPADPSIRPPESGRAFCRWEEAPLIGRRPLLSRSQALSWRWPIQLIGTTA